MSKTSGTTVPVKRLPQIERMILLVRGHKAMLDRDLAALYGVQTRVLNQAVKRNIKRFPEDFMLTLTREEIGRISQSVTSSDRQAALKFSKNVNVFTEQGVAMLSSVLKSERAIQVNVEIMRAFVRLRGLLAEHAGLARRLDELEHKYDSQFAVVFEAIRELMSPSEDAPKERIGFRRRGER